MANPSTGKSPILAEITQKLYELEKLDGINLGESHLGNPGTVEACISLLKDKGYMFLSYDESAAFFRVL